jgi:hypothetical protein
MFFETCEELMKLVDTKGRIDRKIAPACEALGLIEFKDKKEILDNMPTKFFFKLIESDGKTAAIYMLARHLSLPFPTFEYLNQTPLEILSNTANKEFDYNKTMDKSIDDVEHYNAVLYAYTEATYPWIKKSIPNNEDEVPKNFIEKVVGLNLKFNTENWRNNLPDKTLLELINDEFIIGADMSLKTYVMFYKSKRTSFFRALQELEKPLSPKELQTLLRLNLFQKGTCYLFNFTNPIHMKILFKVIDPTRKENSQGMMAAFFVLLMKPRSQRTRMKNSLSLLMKSIEAI